MTNVHTQLLKKLWLACIPVKRHLNRLPSRQQHGLCVLMLFLAVVVGVQLLQTGHERWLKAQQRLADTQHDLQWMRAQQAIVEAKKAQPTRTASDPRSLVSIATDTARRNNITVTRFQPDGEHALRLWVEQAPYAQALAWLLSLRSVHGVELLSSTIQQHNVAGSVGLSVELVKHP